MWEWKCCEIEFGLHTEHRQQISLLRKYDLTEKKKCWSLFVGPTHARGSYEYMTMTSKKVAHSAHIKVYIMWREHFFLLYTRNCEHILGSSCKYNDNEKSCSELVILITSCRSTQKEKKTCLSCRALHIYFVWKTPRELDRMEISWHTTKNQF